MVSNYWRTFKRVNQWKNNGPIIYTSTCCKISAINRDRRVQKLAPCYTQLRISRQTKISVHYVLTPLFSSHYSAQGNQQAEMTSLMLHISYTAPKQAYDFVENS
jgi:hypothetical protein